jgi:hypothetical protein
MPDAADDLQLMDCPFFGAKKIDSIGKDSLLSGTNAALSPASRFRRAPMPLRNWRRIDSELNGIFNSGRKRGDQAASSLQQIVGRRHIATPQGWRFTSVDLVLSFFEFHSLFGRRHDGLDTAFS